MNTANYQTTSGTLLWADARGCVWSYQTNGLNRQYFVTADEAEEQDEKDCNTHIVESLPYIEDYELLSAKTWRICPPRSDK